MSHRPLCHAGFGISISAICACGLIYVRAVSSQGANVTSVVALTAEHVERTTGMISQQSVERRIVTAIRSDKSRATGAALGDVSGVLRVIALRPERTIVTIDNKNKLKSTLYLSPAPEGATAPPIPRAPLAKRRDCERPQGAESIGDQNIGGVSAVGYRHISKDASGTTTAEDWFAPSLGCFVLENHAEYWGADGVLKSRFQRLTVSLIIGEPDSSFFIVPADFVEAPPSALEMRRLPSSAGVPDSVRERWKRDDARYYAALAEQAGH
jgi:hypothetical protein